MSKPIIVREVLTDPSWRHWVITIPLLGCQLAGWSWGIWSAVGLCAAMYAYYFVRIRSLQPYPVQIRFV